MKLLNRIKTTLTGLWRATGMLVAAQPQMDMEQTLSDQAQGMTIAFDALAFLTGSLGADSFLPPGKVADFSGFQYLRDNDPTELGHNTDFVTIIANNILNLLSSAQVSQLVERAKIQAALINQYGCQRFPLMDAFRRQLAGDLPAGTSGLDLAAVKSYSGELYRLDGRISLDRALLFGSLLRSFDSSQLSALNHLATLGGVGHWPQNLADPLRGLNLAPEIGVGVMTYASEMYSWYAGSVAADTYFCPERQGTYFGSFYLKDAPAMGNPNYSIGTNLTADSGNALLAALTPAQQALITNLVTVQKPYLYELVNTRSNIAVRLRQLLVASAIDTNAVLDLCCHYGELDGQIVYSYATHFAQVGQSLGTNQQAALQALRLQLLGQDLLYPSGAYLYSAPIAMPAITNTDFLFGTNSATTHALSVVATGASLTRLASGLHFTEGPAADAAGNLFFADIPANTIYEWSLANQLSVFRTNSGGANGLGFDRAGNLLACEGSNGRVVSITPQGGVTSLASAYAGVRFNEPNDLWVDPAGGVYFTDPVYFGHAAVQGGEHVYYLSPDRARLVRVAADLVRPNGLAGTADGKTLYVADWGATKVFRYTINADGTLGNPTLFASVKCDGLTLDALGHVYLCETAVLVYDAAGRPLEQISVPERPTNLEFGGRDRQTLFITTDAGSLYAIPMRVQGVGLASVPNQAPVIASTSITPPAPTTNDTVWVTAQVTDDTSVSQVTLTYSTGTISAGQTNLLFLETMGTNLTKPWTGDGCNNAWTVTFAGANPFEQRDGASYGQGNTNGAEFKGGTTNLTDSMLAPTQTIDARGTSGFVEFWLWADGLAGNAGWTFQIDAGSGYATRLSELAGANHNWQLYRYNLQSDELVAGLKLRWQFRGGLEECRIDLDQVSVRTIIGGGSSTQVAMLDDGTHHDGAAGDGIYGAEIPAFPAGATVSYYITAADSQGMFSTEPGGAPGSVNSFTTSAGVPAPVLMALRMTPAGMQLSWASLPNRNYAVLHKATLDAPAWTNIATSASTGEVTTFIDADLTRLGLPQGYYWVTLLP